MNDSFTVLTYNVCWEAMTETNTHSHPKISEICAEGRCQKNVLSWLDRNYSICCIQEASFDLVNLPLKEQYHVFYSQSGPEPMITIIDKNRWRPISGLGYEFSLGRPIQCLLLEDLLTTKILGVINLHAGHHGHNNIHNLSDIIKEELVWWESYTNRSKNSKPFKKSVDALIVVGDFNAEIWPANLISDKWLLSGLNDFASCCGLSYNNQSESHKPLKPCDYIAYTSNLVSISCELFEVSGPASDHHPIVGEFIWN